MKNQPTRLEMFFTRLAFFFYGKSVYKAFADRLPLNGNERVLDFGCGMGTVAYYTVKRIPNGHLTCIDISERWLNRCRRTLRRYENVSVIEADASWLQEGGFDVVYCHFVLHDISENEQEAVIPALAKALKPGGLLIFREPLHELKKVGFIKQLLTRSKLSHKESRIIYIPLMGSTLESIYIKL